MTLSDHEYHATIHPGCDVLHDTAIGWERVGSAIYSLIDALPHGEDDAAYVSVSIDYGCDPDLRVSVCANSGPTIMETEGRPRPPETDYVAANGATIEEAAQKCLALVEAR